LAFLIVVFETSPIFP